MVYDCFVFFNELDLLEIRLNELNDVVDKFVLVEATRTFQKKEKPLYFEQNKARFAPFLDKIIHIVIDEYPGFFAKFRVPTTWDYENHQREQIKQGLVNCKPNDVVIISDLDEIPNPTKVAQYKDKSGIRVFEQRLFFYYLNGLCTYYDTGDKPRIAQPNKNGLGYWRGTVMCNYQDLKTVKKARLWREFENERTTVVEEGGWHFSYLGGTKKIIQKLEAYAHTEFNADYYKDEKRVEEIISQGKDLFDTQTSFKFIELDDTMPRYIQQNADKYPHLIKK